jgi:hypothetical protein
MSLIDDLRKQYHQQICERILFIDKDGIPNNADRHSRISVSLAKGIFNSLGLPCLKVSPPGQTSGKLFEQITATFLENAFNHLQHLRPGEWRFQVGQHVDKFEQYEHLADLAKTLKAHRELRATLGDYMIVPDIMVGRLPVSDGDINLKEDLVGSSETAKLTPLRENNSKMPILHASISCKWTIRSDRSQNARTEGLNLIRNRKGKTPHICIVTAEPYPQRIASLALGTGDIDCVYHIALPELQKATQELDNPAVTEMMDILLLGKG